jgi:hypothetical protein
MLKLVARFTAALASAPVAVCAGDLTGEEIRIGVAAGRQKASVNSGDREGQERLTPPPSDSP